MISERSYTIGREKDCNIVLADETVSRKHATITIQRDGGLLLTDCHSVNGTFVQEGPSFGRVQHAIVTPSHSIKFGEVVWSVSELLEAIRQFDPEASISTGKTPEYHVPARPPHKNRLVRCRNCARAIPPEQNCPYCDSAP